MGHDRENLVSGDSLGYVRIFGYPCINAKSEFHQDKPMSGPVSSTRFMPDDSMIIAVGGNDAAIYRYKIK